MVGNAVPVNFARLLASKIMEDVQQYLIFGACSNLRKIKYSTQLTLINPNFDTLVQKQEA
jgi:DNA (cytosine-5)-methyltransferase 1